MSNQRYLVTARKYRPMRFGDLVAQQHVTETLKNALRLDRLAHAYLFSGPRGVGKTTAARILAKAINCTTEPDQRPDADEPCRKCASCRDFEEGRSLSIFEIDAASNNKVEDIRDLRDTIRIPPQGSRKKVYIIDEVHMLSNAAFNALLKTLEEPPPYVLFIFATTEPHKVLPTILSRCQRFDFRRIPVPDIVAHLKEICEKEDITADEASLMLLARKGDGALRDALSAFDQAVSLCGTDLHYADLADALRVVDIDLFFEATEHVAAHSSPGMLRLVDHIVRSGYDLQEFLVGLSEHLRNLLVARTMDDTTLIEAAQATRQRYTEASRTLTETDLLRLLMIADEAEESIKSSTHPRMKMEMALLKMASLAHTADLRQALQQLDRLEAMAREGKLAPGLFAPAEAPAAPPPQTDTAHPAEAAPPPEEALGKSTPRAAEPEPARAAPRPFEETRVERPTPSEEAEPVEATPESPKEAEPSEEAEPVGAAPESPEEAEPSEEAEPVEATPELFAEAARTPASTTPPHQEQRPEPPAPPSYPSLFGTPALQKKAPRNATPDEAPEAQDLLAGSRAVATLEAVTVAPDSALGRVASVWTRYVQAVKAERIHVGALLQHTTPLAVEASAITVGAPDAFHQRLLGNQHDFLVKHLQAFDLKEISRLTFTVRQDLEASTPQATASDIDPQEYMQRKRQENPVIQAIFEQFGGELVW